MAKTDLEKTSEEGMIPLVFLDVAFDGKSKYKRLDTREVLVERVEDFCGLKNGKPCEMERMRREASS